MPLIPLHSKPITTERWTDSAIIEKSGGAIAHLILRRLVVKAFAELVHLRPVRLAGVSLYPRALGVQVHHVHGLLRDSLLHLCSDIHRYIFLTPARLCCRRSRRRYLGSVSVSQPLPACLSACLPVSLFLCLCLSVSISLFLRSAFTNESLSLCGLNTW